MGPAGEPAPQARPAPKPQPDLPFTLAQARPLGPFRQWFADHPRGADVLVIVVYVVTTAPDLALYGNAVWSLVIFIPVAVGLWFRRRYPLQMLALILLACVVMAVVLRLPTYPLIAVAFSVYTVASLRPPLTAWLAFAVSALTTAALTLLPVSAIADPEIVSIEPDIAMTAEELAFQITITAIVSSVLLLLIALAIGLSVRARRERTQEIVDRANRIALEREQREQLAIANERSRIAREMHDVVAHSLSVMVALSDGARASLEQRPERSAQALAELSSTGRQALDEMRSILGVLRSYDVADADTPFDGDAPLSPTSADLGELIARFRTAGLPVIGVHTGAALPSQPGPALAIYRVVQESLTNVLRHVRKPRVVEVATGCAAGRVTITVTDSGGTPVGRPGSGRGMVGMRERVAAFGGTVEAGPTANGWQVRATFDVPEGRSS